MAKATHGISVDRNTDTMTATYKLTDKAAEKVIDTLTVAWADVHDDCKPFLKLYGLTKFQQDRKSQTDIMDKFPAYTEVMDMLKIGQLLADRKSSGPTIKLEVEALANFKKMSVKQAQQLLKKYSKEDQEVIFANDGVQKELKKLKDKLEKVDESESLDDMLAS